LSRQGEKQQQEEREKEETTRNQTDMRKVPVCWTRAPSQGDDARKALGSVGGVARASRSSLPFGDKNVEKGWRNMVLVA
jgi:hypothetical protein